MRLVRQALLLLLLGLHALLCCGAASKSPSSRRRGRVPANSAHSRKVHFDALSLKATTFLSRDDFFRAKNLSFVPAESAPPSIALAPGDGALGPGTVFFEGDMMIQESDESKVAMYTAKRWPDGRIPYVMEDKFTEEERAAIARGIMLLQERTCIVFEPRLDSDDDYVLIRRGPGCAAHVGRIGGQQWIILGDGCFGIETVTHELMHSVGFIHEQSRPDRDDHVEIIWENIKPSAKRNFRKHEFDYLADHGFPYDLMSVMHYRQYAFSKNRKPTIVPKTPVPYLRCRGLDCPSELDIKKINFLYKCEPKDEHDHEENHYGNDLDSESDVEEVLVGARNVLRSRPRHLGDYELDGNSSEDEYEEPRWLVRRRPKPIMQRTKAMKALDATGWAFPRSLYLAGEPDDDDDEAVSDRTDRVRRHRPVNYGPTRQPLPRPKHLKRAANHLRRRDSDR